MSGYAALTATYLYTSMHYRRAFTPGGSFFFTLVNKQRRPIFTSAETVETLRNAIRAVRASRPFNIDAMVVMPEHLHCIWTLPPDDADFSTRWRLIKTWFTKHHEPDQRAQAIWQQRYWEHQIRDEADFARHVDLHPLQPRQARPRRLGYGLAAFKLSPPCGSRNLSRRLGPGCDGVQERWVRIALCAALFARVCANLLCRSLRGLPRRSG
jgi:putative transposase